MNKLWHYIKYFFSINYRFKRNGWVPLEATRISPDPHKPIRCKCFAEAGDKLCPEHGGSALEPRQYEAGVTSIQYPYSPRWTGDFVMARSDVEAEDLFQDKGYYRNLVVREAN